MIIHEPSQSKASETETRISARIELEKPLKRSLPEELWFKFPKSSAPSLDSDPFVVALLLLAMQGGEDIEVRGSLSRELAEALQSYQKVFHSWYPERFKLIQISAAKLRDDPPPPAPRAQEGCAFSGGVDSFYSYLVLRERLTSVIFMAGFDMPLNLTASISELDESFAHMMQEHGKELISGSTNIRAFVNTVDWTNAHGPALAAAALFFKNRWSQFYVPSSYTAGSSPKWGTHPELEPLLSTSVMEFVHHGTEANRLSKLALIQGAEESYARLRVCWIQDIGLRNCGECEKCLRTMIALDLLGALGLYATFGVQKLDYRKVRALPMRTHQARVFALELMREALKRRNWTALLSLAWSLMKRQLRFTMRK